jgi:hypothetical protein
MRQSRRHVATSLLHLIRNAFAVRERLGDPRDLPYFRLPYFPYMPSTLPRWSTVSSRYTHTAIPGFLELVPSRQPQPPASASNSRRGILFRGCIVLFILRPACLPSPPGWLRQDETTCLSPLPSEVHCHSRFRRRPSPDCAGSQARWANGKSHIVGTLTRQVTAASEAAHQ